MHAAVYSKLLSLFLVVFGCNVNSSKPMSFWWLEVGVIIIIIIVIIIISNFRDVSGYAHFACAIQDDKDTNTGNPESPETDRNVNITMENKLQKLRAILPTVVERQ